MTSLYLLVLMDYIFDVRGVRLALLMNMAVQLGDFYLNLSLSSLTDLVVGDFVTV